MGIHPPTSEQARPATLAGYDLGGPSRRQDLETVVRLAAHVCGAPMGALNLILGPEHRQPAALGFEAADRSAAGSICSVAIEQAEAEPGGRDQEPASRPAAVPVPAADPAAHVVVVPDARRDPRFSGNPHVAGVSAPVCFYAAALLRAPGDGVIGTLCVFDTDLEHGLTTAQRGRLADLGELAVTVLELHRRTRLLDSAARAARLSEHEMERATAALSRFADQVGRDLKHPATGVRSLLERLAELPAVGTDPEALQYVNRAMTSAARINAVVNAVQEHASVGGVLDIGEVDLSELVAGILDELESEIRTARARVTVGRLPTVPGDAAQLRAVMHNLVSNAVRYRHPRRLCKVQITGERVEGGWVIRVADNGVGIPPEHRYEVLQMFTRLHGDHGQVEGHGIGLATCRRIIEAHEGDILLEDTPGGGTTVVFHLPDRAYRPDFRETLSNHL